MGRFFNSCTQQYIEYVHKKYLHKIHRGENHTSYYRTTKILPVSSFEIKIQN